MFSDESTFRTLSVVARNGDCYLNLMKEKLLHRIEIHCANNFLQDGNPCHKSRKVLNFFKDSRIEVINWPANRLDLKQTEKNIWTQKEMLTLWIKKTPTEYHKKLTESIPEKLRLALKRKGKVTKY
jgi:hypothetical protein